MTIMMATQKEKASSKEHLRSSCSGYLTLLVYMSMRVRRRRNSQDVTSRCCCCCCLRRIDYPCHFLIGTTSKLHCLTLPVQHLGERQTPIGASPSECR